MIDASNVNTCRLDIFSCDVKGFRRPESGKPSRPALKPPSPPHHESASRILAEYVSGYWLYTFTWNATVRLFYSSPFPCLILLCLCLSRRWSSSLIRSRTRSPSSGRCEKCGDGERVERERKESFVQAKTSVTRKNICVIIYQLERKIEIFRDAGPAFTREK